MACSHQTRRHEDFGPCRCALVGRVEDLLDEHFNAESLAVAGSQTKVVPEIQSLQRTLLIEAMHVRGEGTPEMVPFLARGLHAPHSEWFEANLDSHATMQANLRIRSSPCNGLAGCLGWFPQIVQAV